MKTCADCHINYATYTEDDTITLCPLHAAAGEHKAAAEEMRQVLRLVVSAEAGAGTDADASSAFREVAGATRALLARVRPDGGRR